jgi:hypothetical protein
MLVLPPVLPPKKSVDTAQLYGKVKKAKKVKIRCNVATFTAGRCNAFSVASSFMNSN